MMPEALTTHSGVESLIGCLVPAAISAAFLRFSRRANSLNVAHSSSFSRTVSGFHTPCPVIEVLVVVRTAMAHLTEVCPATAPSRAGMVDRDRARRVGSLRPVSYTHLRAHETPEHLVC